MNFVKDNDNMPQKITIGCLNVIIMVIFGKELLNDTEKEEILLAFGNNIYFAYENMQHFKNGGV